MKRSLGILVIVLLILTSVSSFAAGQITATLNSNFVLKLDGEVVPVLDSYGKPTDPIVYNNTTYLPLRYLSNLFNVPLAVDGTVVSLGKLAPENSKSVTPEGTGFYFSKIHTTGKTFDNKDFVCTTAAYFESVTYYSNNDKCKILLDNAREFSFNICGSPESIGDKLVIQMFDNNNVLLDKFVWESHQFGKVMARKSYDVTGLKYVKFIVEGKSSDVIRANMVLADPIIVVPR